jgi:hypothetical protein
MTGRKHSPSWLLCVQHNSLSEMKCFRASCSVNKVCYFVASLGILLTDEMFAIMFRKYQRLRCWLFELSALHRGKWLHFISQDDVTGDKIITGAFPYIATADIIITMVSIPRFRSFSWSQATGTGCAKNWYTVWHLLQHITYQQEACILITSGVLSWKLTRMRAPQCHICPSCAEHYQVSNCASRHTQTCTFHHSAPKAHLSFKAR